jgi:dye decolorizing peroxidase
VTGQDGDRAPARLGRRHLLRAGTLGVGAFGVGTAAVGLDRSLRA